LWWVMTWMAEKPENGTKNKVLYDILLKIILLCLSFYLVDILLNVMIHLVCCEKLRLEIVIK
jgi:hypothetical protein